MNLIGSLFYILVLNDLVVCLATLNETMTSLKQGKEGCCTRKSRLYVAPRNLEQFNRGQEKHCFHQFCFRYFRNRNRFLFRCMQIISVTSESSEDLLQITMRGKAIC